MTRLTKKLLTKLYSSQMLTGDQIATLLNLGRGVVYCALRKYKIKTRTSGFYQSIRDKTQAVAWKGFGELSATTWNRIKRKARERNISIRCSGLDVWNQFVRQKGCCALTGIKLQLTSTPSDSNASLDRIDSSKPYSKDNIQWVYKPINLMKHTLSMKEFIQLCRIVINHLQK